MIHPTFVVIGAMRSGTTSLHHFLARHPEIYMSPIKGPGLYLDPQERITYPSKYRSIAEKRRGLSDPELVRDMRSGYAGERHFGESTDLYTRYPALGRSVPEKMLQCNPAMKLIYIMRNPLDRIVSQFRFELSKPHNAPPRSLQAYLDCGTDAVATSLYGFQISRFLAGGFSPEDVHLIVFEELRQDPGEGMQGIAEFLALDRCETPALPHLNGSERKPARDGEDLLFSGEQFRKLRRYIDADLEGLERLMGRRIAAWDLSGETWCRPEDATARAGDARRSVSASCIEAAAASRVVNLPR